MQKTSKKEKDMLTQKQNWTTKNRKDWKLELEEARKDFPYSLQKKHSFVDTMSLGF